MYKLTTEQKRAKKNLEIALKNFDHCGLAFISVCSGTKSTLKILTPEAFNAYVKVRSHEGQCEIAENCESIADHNTWEGELVP